MVEIGGKRLSLPVIQGGMGVGVSLSGLAGAVAAAHQEASAGDVVVLSPACAAFDQFKNFMERGRVFKELVQAL